MCLGVPGRVVRKISEIEVIVDFGGITRRVDALLVPDIREGDYVIVHAGAIIGKIDEKAYREILDIYKEIAKLEESEK